LRVTFLGTGGAGAPPGRAENSILVEGNETRIILDCGPGCGQRLYETGYNVRDIDYVYVSHLHLDHWSGLFELTVYAASENTEPPSIVLPEPIIGEAKNTVVGMLPHSMRPRINLVEARLGEELELGDLRLRITESSHSIPCYGAIVEENGGARLLYTSDTRITKTYQELARIIDVLITEATMPTRMREIAGKTGHQTVAQATSYRKYMERDSLLALIHLTIQSIGEAKKAQQRGILVPNDLTTITI
jgi:ribonuclease Z